MPWWGLLIIFWICMHALNVVAIANVGWIYHPAAIYKNDDRLNWFGAVFLYILFMFGGMIFGHL